MRSHETVTAAFKDEAVGFAGVARVAMTESGRLLGLDAGDWSMMLLGLVLSILLLALV
ncbi:MAG: hypothetical protein WBF58_03525 [Xanthobacteraceae bacterium]